MRTLVGLSEESKDLTEFPPNETMRGDLGRGTVVLAAVGDLSPMDSVGDWGIAKVVLVAPDVMEDLPIAPPPPARK
ncbi:UNVERIFIED_CONTAM: hypothetical protein HDU68_004625 [Siphonaria sp. JEL0065]|nr:hypothetical protein HDU68_004625 [Siphonaria sp. JEL0065]